MSAPQLPASRNAPAWRFLSLAAVLLLPLWSARAHVGSPDVFSAGQAGPYPVGITIRMPPVVPGRAQIEVRVRPESPVTVSVLPLYSKTAIKNAPPAEAAQPVAGEPGLYSSELWLMSVGAYSIEVQVAGAEGKGSIQIPVNSVATSQLPLPPFLGGILLGLGALLCAGAVGIVHAAAGESTLAEATLDASARRKAWVASAVTAVVLILSLVGGWRWWMATEQHFRRTLREAAWPDLVAKVEITGAQRILQLTLGEKAFKPNHGIPLLPDHGKLLHTFLIREPARDVFAHVHPIRKGGKTFALALPDLPEGEYRVLCDFTMSESGLSSTATTTVRVPPAPASGVPAAKRQELQPDPDDSWFAGTPAPAVAAASPPAEESFSLPGGQRAIWKAHPPLRMKADARLEFSFQDADGQPVPLEPYMGMMGHAAVISADGQVFSHLHPTGNFSMAAQTYFAEKIAKEAASQPGAAEPEEMDHAKMGHGASGVSAVLFPYEFPLPGDYQIWVQVKCGEQILTATFRASVGP